MIGLMNKEFFYVQEPQGEVFLYSSDLVHSKLPYSGR